MVILLIVLAASTYFRSLQICVSVLLGGLIGLVSFIILRRGIENLVYRQQQSSSVLQTSFLVLKYPLLLGLIAFLIIKTPLNIPAWVIGFLSLVMGIVLEGIIPTERK